jgi:hypothetical protein
MDPQLKAVLKTLEGLKPEEAEMYKQDGEIFVLDTDKYFHGMSSARDKEKQEAQKLREILKPFEEKLGPLKDMNLEELQEAMKLHQKTKDKQMIDAGKVDELVEQKVTGRVENLKKDYENRLQAAESRAVKAESMLNTLVVDNNVQIAAVKAGVLPEAMEDVSYRASKVFRAVDGKPIPMKGDEVIYGKDGKTPLTMDEWLEELKSRAPHFFKRPEGSGTRPGAGNGGAENNTSGLMGVERLKAARRRS